MYGLERFQERFLSFYLSVGVYALLCRTESLKSTHFRDTIVLTRGLHLQVWLLTSKVNSLTFHFSRTLAHNRIT